VPLLCNLACQRVLLACPISACRRQLILIWLFACAFPAVKPRNVPVQLLQSGDRGGEGLHAPGSRMLIDARTRKGPFFHLSQRAGAWCFTHYNNMYHPRCVMSREEGGMDAEYEQLCKRVAVINVAVERQIQVKGPDAEAFVDLVITRKASLIKVGSAKYVILCNPQGGIINDPVLLRIAEDEFWFSIADSGAGLYLQGVNALGTYDVTIREIDVAPLSVAGPYALDTVRTLVGPRVDDIPYFGLIEADIAGCSTIVTRTGFSSEKNFEIFLRNAHANADTLYNAIMAAGAPFGIREIAIPVSQTSISLCCSSP
jgi:glycine cleavage system aminomethyltransferase T